MEEAEKALEYLNKIARNRREYDNLSHQMLEGMREDVVEVTKNFYNQNSENTLRGFIEPLDLHFDLEDFIDDSVEIEVTPEVLAVAVYLNEYPETLSKGVSDQIYEKYVEPYSSMDRNDHFFYFEEYIQEYK